MVSCDTCTKLKQLICSSKAQRDNKQLVVYEADLKDHLEVQRAHRSYESALRGVAKTNSRVQVVNVDHMAKKALVKPQKYSKSSFKECATFKILPGGYYVSKYNTTHYYLTTERYGETKNTILSELHCILKKLLVPETENIHFIMDNHSTNKNFTVLAYFDYLVRVSF